MSEEVLASLRLLFFMLLNMTKAVMPDEPLTDQEMGPIQQLVQEVKNQQGKIQDPRTVSGDLEPAHTIQSTLPDEPDNSNGDTG